MDPIQRPTRFSPRQHPLKPRGFSLVELLVVVALVAVISVLAFRVMSGVRNTQLETRCVSNLRQLGTALTAYIADHNGGVPPRNLGLYRADQNPPAARPPATLRAWPGRLLNLGYLENPEVLYCPAMFPKSLKEARRDPAAGNACETYGMRIWGIPGRAWDGHREEHKPITAVDKPQDFFIIADSLWTSAGWECQGYSISPSAKDQVVHLRHNRRANALFLDGHVEAKPASYFENLHHPDQQGAYSNNRPFYTLESLPSQP